MCSSAAVALTRTLHASEVCLPELRSSAAASDVSVAHRSTSTQGDVGVRCTACVFVASVTAEACAQAWDLVRGIPPAIEPCSFQGGHVLRSLQLCVRVSGLKLVF